MNKDFTILSFVIDKSLVRELEDHIDKTKIKLRGKGVKFSKKQMFSYMMEHGLREFDVNDFLASVGYKEPAAAMPMIEVIHKPASKETQKTGKQGILK